MLLWFAGLAVVIVWQVFRDTAVDYRLVMAGAVAPDVADLATTCTGTAHTLLAGVGVLVAVMVLTRGRRRLRRRLLALPIGIMLHLLLDGAWMEPRLFWWPMLGTSLDVSVPLSFHRPALVLALQEAVGLMALSWWVWRFRLHETARRREFVRTGRLGRDLVT